MPTPGGGRRTAVIMALSALSVSLVGVARADDTDLCLSAPVEGQKLQKEGKLLAAREKFTLCARKTCPGEIIQDCTRWAGEVEAAVPTVVMAARDQAGHDMTDVSVSIDGKPPIPMSARATSVDPGSHRFVFRRGGTPRQGGAPGPGGVEVSPDGTDAGAIEQVTILREGEKNREVVATFRVAVSERAAPPAALVTERPVPAAAWVSGAFGVAGFAVLAVAGSLGVSQRSSEHCDTGCPQAQKTGVDNLFNVADIGLGVGAVGIGVAAILFLARPTALRPATAAYLDVRRAPGGGVAVLGGRF